MKKIKQLIKNATQSITTSILGGIIGLPELIQGINENNGQKIIVGLATFLLGLFAKENNE